MVVDQAAARAVAGRDPVVQQDFGGVEPGRIGQFGQVEIPQSAFIAALKMDDK